jgi:tetratricopeptide (TPR) repeat protein
MYFRAGVWLINHIMSKNHPRGLGRTVKGAVCGALLVLGASGGDCWAAAAKAQDTSAIGKAVKLREQFKYDDALRVLEKAANASTNTPEQATTIDLLEGVLHFELGRTDLAETSFRSGLKRSPNARLPVDVSPKITELLEKVRAEVKAPPVTETPVDPVSERPPEGPNGPSLVDHRTGTGLRDRLSPYRVPVAIVGGGVAVVGALSWARAKSLEQGLRRGDPSITTREQLDDTVSKGKTFETAGWVLVGVGAAATVGSLLLLRPSGATPAVSAVPTPGGAQVALLWSTP